MKTYRPVSNVSFLSKVIEKAVGISVNITHNWFKNINQYQSVYNEFPSAETSLLKINTDLLSSIAGDGRVTALTFLDLSSAFSTIDHTILLNRLDGWFGFTWKALKRLKSYLTGTCQGIKLGDCLSSRIDLLFGVLQSINYTIKFM